MTCEESRLCIATELFQACGDDRGDNELAEHLASCAGCRSEADQIRKTWERLQAVPDPEPRPWVASRFYASLDAYEQGMREQQSGFWKWWPKQPVFQVALSAGCLALGLVAGTLGMGRPALAPASSGEIAELRKEMTGMRQLVTLSLLQQQSASERLRGVTWSYRAEPNDMEVLSALLRTINTDNNVDVRLAAVEALRTFGDSPIARRGLANALPKQDSPLVLISIIDALVELKINTAAAALETLGQLPNVDPQVKKRVDEALHTLQ